MLYSGWFLWIFHFFSLFSSLVNRQRRILAFGECSLIFGTWLNSRTYIFIMLSSCCCCCCCQHFRMQNLYTYTDKELVIVKKQYGFVVTAFLCAICNRKSILKTMLFEKYSSHSTDTIIVKGNCIEISKYIEMMRIQHTHIILYNVCYIDGVFVHGAPEWLCSFESNLRTNRIHLHFDNEKKLRQCSNVTK